MRFVAPGRELIDTLDAVRAYDFAVRELPGHGLKAVARHLGVAGPDRELIRGDQIFNVFRTDPARVRQVLDNLLSNAVKFSPRGGVVRVSARRGGAFAEVTVSDSGPGVPPGERAVIFDRYRQTAAGRSRGGAGLGLAIAAGIVGAHGGTIRCEDVTAGADFTFTLPLARP